MSERERKIYLNTDDIDENIDLDAEVEENVEVIDDTIEQPEMNAGDSDQAEESDDDYEVIDDTMPQRLLPLVISNHNLNRGKIAELPDISESMFLRHSEPVLCCDISPSGLLAATGGQDDRAFIWKVDTKQELLDTGNQHKESVCVVKFNRNSTHLVTADLNGLIKVWKIHEDTVTDVGTHYLCDQVTWLFWDHRNDFIFYIGSDSGEGYLYDITPKRLRTHAFPTFGTPTDCAKLFHNQDKIVIGYGNGTLRVFGLDDTQKTLRSITISTKAVVSLEVSDDDRLIAAGSIDSAIKVFKSHTGELVYTLQNCHGPEFYAEYDRMNSVECILFTPNNTLTTGMVMESLKVWDLNTGLNRFDLKLRYGICKLVPDKREPHIVYAACLDGLVRVIDVRSCDVLKELTGHQDQLLDMCVAPDYSFVLTASDDKTARIFRL